MEILIIIGTNALNITRKLTFINLKIVENTFIYHKRLLSAKMKLLVHWFSSTDAHLCLVAQIAHV